MVGRLTILTLLILLAGVGFEARPHGSSQPSPRPSAPSASDHNLAIIINRTNPLDDVSLAELRKIFRGERSHWKNGRRVTLVMMEQGHEERTAALRDLCEMSENEFNRHFLQRIFTGEVFVSPKTLATPVGVRKFVFNVPGAIGYVRPSDVDDSVKVLRVNGHLPDEKDYPIQIEPGKYE